MVYKPGSVDGDVLRWSVTGSGVTCEVDESYTPIDFSREFRYCLEKDIDPLPTHELSQMQIAVSETELASETVTELTIDDEIVTGSGADVLATLSARVSSIDPEIDPDVLFLNTSDLIPVLFQQADRLERGAVDPSELVITNRVSKQREDYTQSTRSVVSTLIDSFTRKHIRHGNNCARIGYRHRRWFR